MHNTGQRDQSTSVFSELKRRNIFHVALLYMVAAWLILQLANVLLEQLGVPSWVFRFIFTLLLICFPAVLAFSWVCEITPQGLKHGQHVDAEASITARTGRKINHITSVLLIFAILSVAVDYLLPEPFLEQGSQITMKPPGIDLQGHRGARGLLPENSIPAFLYALELGVTTLEMDVAINAEGHAVVSHEPWMSARICTHADGRFVTEDEEKSLRIYTMTDEDVAGFDCGSRGHPEFPLQKAMPVAKPLLSAVLQAVALQELETDRLPVLFNIEIKSLPEGDRIFHPEVTAFATALYKVVSEHGTVDRTSIQSFDARALEAMHAIDPDISIVLLVENHDGLDRNLAKLSFTPQIYSPDYTLLDEAQIESAHAKNIQVIPWTINDEETIQKLVNMGVDGLITDYPDLGIKVLADILKAQ